MNYLDFSLGSNIWMPIIIIKQPFFGHTIASLKNGHQNGYNSVVHFPLKSQRKPPKFLISTLLLLPI